MAVLAVIIAVLVILAVIPIRVYVEYRGGLRVLGRVLFVEVPIYPRKPKAEKERENEAEPEIEPVEPLENLKPKEEKSEKKESAEETPPEEIKPQETKKVPKEKKQVKQKKPKAEPKPAENGQALTEKLAEYLKKAEEILGLGRKIVRRLITVESLNVRVAVGADEADKTAILAGMLWSVGYGIIALADKIVKIRRHNLNIVPVYNSVTLEGEADCILRTNLANIIGAAAIAGIAYVRYKIKNRRKTK